MMLETRKTLGDDGGRSVRPEQLERQRIEKPVGRARPRSRGAQAHRLAVLARIPEGEIGEMHELLEDPGADARGIVSPAARSQPKGTAEEGDALEAHLSDLTFFDELAGRAPLMRDAKLMVERDKAAVLTRGRDHGVAFVERQAERLFQEHMGTPPQCGDREFGMPMIGNADADDVDRNRPQHLVVIAEAPCSRQLPACRELRCLPMTIDADDPRFFDRAKCPGGHLAPGSEAGKGDPYFFCFRHHLSRCRRRGGRLHAFAPASQRARPLE